MSTVRIEFEIEEADLAKAKEFVTQNGGSLDGLVSAFLACVGQGDSSNQLSVDDVGQLLVSVSAGQISVMEAARLLGFPDAGYALRNLARAGFRIQGLAERGVLQQLESGRMALEQCLLDPEAGTKNKSRR